MNRVLKYSFLLIILVSMGLFQEEQLFVEAAARYSGSRYTPSYTRYVYTYTYTPTYYYGGGTVVVGGGNPVGAAVGLTIFCIIFCVVICILVSASVQPNT